MRTLFLLFFILSTFWGTAQTFTDAEIMGKREVCLAAMYMHDSWDTYYEADLKRINGNIGTLTRQTGVAAAVYGVTSNLTFISMLPFAHAAASQGTLASASGFQDLAAGLKYKIKLLDNGVGINVFAMSFGSTPVSNYNTELGPISLGANCKEWANRAMVEFTHKNSGIFLRSWASYHMRGMCQLERTYYFTDGAYYSDKVNVPDQWQMATTLGARFLEGNLRIEATFMKINSIGGADIRKYEMPFPGTGMDASTLSGLIQYYPKFFPKLGIQLGYLQLVKGRNAGISTVYSGGVMYRFSI